MITIPRRTRQQFLWIPPVRATTWSVTIKDTDISDDLIEGKFTRGLIGQEMGCEIELDNGSEIYTNLFKIGDTITFKMDFSSGSTVQWQGDLEEQRNKLNDAGFILNIRGAHHTAKLLDITVIDQFTNSLLPTIIATIVTENLPGFTTGNVERKTTLVDITWNNKPIMDAMIDLVNLGQCDCYIDNSKDFHFFNKNSKPNDNEAMVINDGLFEIEGLGSDSVDIRNKVTVYGEAGELPVIATSPDSASQTEFGIKERIINDNSIIDESEAEAIGDAELQLNKDPAIKGSATGLFMPTLNPGDTIYVIYPQQGIHDRFRVSSFTFKVPDEIMTVNFDKESTVPQLFKDRERKELRQEKIVNPFKMTNSYNFTFDNEAKIDSTISSNFIVEDSIVRWDNVGEKAIIVSITKITPVTAGSVHVLARGEALSGAKFFVQADTGAVFQEITLDTLTELNADNKGTDLRLKIEIDSVNTRVDAVAVLYKT